MNRFQSNSLRGIGTIAVPILLVAAIVLACIWLLFAPVPQTTSMYMVPTIERGWPWAFQTISEYRFNSPPALFDGFTTGSFHAGYFAADVAILSVIALLVTAAMVWRRRRSGSWLRFSLRGLLILVALCAVPLAWWATVDAAWKQEQLVIEQFGVGYTAERPPSWIYCGPAWLRRFVPWSEQKIFRRAIVLDVDWSAHENAAVEVPAAIDQLRYVKRLEITASQPVRVADVARLSRIEIVNIIGPGVDDQTMQWIARLPHLQLFQITTSTFGADSCQATDRGFALLAQCPELFEIICSRPVNLSEQAIRQLTALPDLRVLEFNEMQITPEMMSAIAKLQHLTLLEFPGCTFTEPASLAELAALPRLESLFIQQTNLTDAALAALAKCPALFELDIENCKNITDEGVLRLLEFSKLKRLFLTGKPQFSAETLQRLQQQIPDVQIYN